MSEERKICTFYLDNFYFGMDVYQIQEIIRYQDMTHVPLAHATIKGLINMRGQIVTAIDMRQRLGFLASPEETELTNIVIRTEDGSVSFLVDTIGDVIDIPIDFFEPPPENLKGKIRQVVKELCQLDDQLLLIMDIDQVLQLSDKEHGFT